MLEQIQSRQLWLAVHCKVAKSQHFHVLITSGEACLHTPLASVTQGSYFSERAKPVTNCRAKNCQASNRPSRRQSSQPIRRLWTEWLPLGPARPLFCRSWRCGPRLPGGSVLQGCSFLASTTALSIFVVHWRQQGVLLALVRAKHLPIHALYPKLTTSNLGPGLVHLHLFGGRDRLFLLLRWQYFIWIIITHNHDKCMGHERPRRVIQRTHAVPPVAWAQSWDWKILRTFREHSSQLELNMGGNWEIN